MTPRFVGSLLWQSPELIRWDLSAIPAGNSITSASITLYLPEAGDPSASGFQFYTLRRAWSEANATWTNADAGIAWGTAGARNPGSDRTDAVPEYTPTGGTAPTVLATPCTTPGRRGSSIE